MGEKIIHEVKIVETDDGFRVEVKGDKERMRKMFDHGMGFGPGMRFKHRHMHHHGPRRGGWGWGYGPWGWWWDDEPEEEGEPATGPAADKPPAVTSIWTCG